MKQTAFFSLLAVVLVLGVGTSGCKHKPLGPTPIPSPKTGKTSATDTFGAEQGKPGPGLSESNSKPVSDGGLGTGGVVTKEGAPLTGWDPATMDQDRGPLAADTVYFDFDSSTIKTSEKSKIESVASYLNANTQMGLLIEGNCDERGTEQYNLSLGERRALAVREYLINLGINSQRVHTLSFGESRPADPAHDEAAWKKNRRDEFVVLKPKQ